MQGSMHERCLLRRTVLRKLSARAFQSLLSWSASIGLQRADLLRSCALSSGAAVVHFH